MPRRNQGDSENAHRGVAAPLYELRHRTLTGFEGKFAAYCRVSTARQGRSGLGLLAQQAVVQAYVNGGAWSLPGEFVEIESGKAVTNRPQLRATLQRAKLTGATLIIAKQDRLSRDVHFLLGLRKAGVDFLAVDRPHAALNGRPPISRSPRDNLLGSDS
jgi:hypothetical protein